MALLSVSRLTNTEMLQNQKLISTLNREGLWSITENMQKNFLVVEKYFIIWVEKSFIRKIPIFLKLKIFHT